MNLAPNFTLAEMARTNHRKLAQHNLDDAATYVDALRSVATMLQVVRDHYGSPVIVHSGYRCPELNTLIGGSPTSQHQRGEAADFSVIGVPCEDVFEWLWHGSQLSWGQLIGEGVVAGRMTWVHLSLGAPWRAPAKSGQVLRWDAAHGYRRMA